MDRARESEDTEMKKLSIRLKITLWFSFVLGMVVLLAFVIVFFVSDAVLQKGVRDNLVEVVESNFNEVEYFGSLQELANSNDVDLYMAYGEGYLEIDDDFLNRVNGIYTGLYQQDGMLLYGQNPLGRAGLVNAFEDGVIQTLQMAGETYYLYDRIMTKDGLRGLCLRGIVSRSQGSVQHNSIVSISLALMSLLVVLAVLVGYMIAGRALRPVKEIGDAAKAICKGKDLKKRISLAPGTDELHQLADIFNGMLQRLDDAFETEQQFISDASHELRTPMSVIGAQCEFTLEKPRSAEEYEKAMRVIQRQSGKMTRLINVLLDFTRLERKSEGFVLETVDMSELVSSMCADMALLREKEIQLTYEVQADVRMQGNRELLSRLLSNLISNAYRYGRSNGKILVGLRKGDGEAEKEIRLWVEDDGVGIPKEQQDKIFRRFFQTDASRSGKGLGLGLAMVKEIVDFHGGEIWVESEPDRGSTFFVSFQGEGCLEQ